jgi:hypothetical protein
MFETLVAAEFADQEELPQSKRVHSPIGISSWAYTATPAAILVDETIDADAKGILPGELPKRLEERAKVRESAAKQWRELKRASDAERDS